MSLIQQSDPKLLSTWTPLSNDEQNRKVFSQRKELFQKWFEKWSAPQRKRIIDEILSSSNMSQLKYINEQVSRRISMKDEDFTRVLPRVVSLYIFSFLDPRTLCRCAQACWYWKYLCELDQLWMLKCLRLDWNISFTPSPYEHGLWKRNYIENFKALQYLRQQVIYIPPEEDNSDTCSSIMTSCSTYKNSVVIDELNNGTPRSARSMRGSSSKVNGGGARPAWRGSDPVPKDTIRFNYLNNTDQVETVKMIRNRAAQKQERKAPRRAVSSHDVTSTDALTQNRMNTADKSLRVLGSEGVTALKNHELSYGQRPTWAEPNNTTHPQPIHEQGSAVFEERMNKLSVRESPRSANNKKFVTLKTSNKQQDPGVFEMFNQKPWKIPSHLENQ